MPRFINRIVGQFVVGSLFGCSVNILQPFANQESDDAYLESAKSAINSGAYQAALDKIALMSAAYAADRKIVVLKASAYAGMCGLTFLPFVQALTNMGSTRLLPLLVNHFNHGNPAKIDACKTAEVLVTSIGTLNNRTADENLLLVLVSFAKMGNVLSLYTDADLDGVADSGVDPCLRARGARPTAGVNGDFFDADLREFGSGLTLAMANIGAVSSTVDVGNASLTDITNACATLGTLNPAYNFCAVTDPAAFTINQLKGIQSMIKENAVVGLGSNCNGAITACNCP